MTTPIEPCGLLIAHEPHDWQLLVDRYRAVPTLDQGRRCDGSAWVAPRPETVTAEWLIDAVAAELRGSGLNPVEANAAGRRIVWRLRDPWARMERETLLFAAAAKLDAQARAHGEGIHDYTDLLRVWASDAARWVAGS